MTRASTSRSTAARVGRVALHEHVALIDPAGGATDHLLDRATELRQGDRGLVRFPVEDQSPSGPLYPEARQRSAGPAAAGAADVSDESEQPIQISNAATHVMRTKGRKTLAMNDLESA